MDVVRRAVVAAAVGGAVVLGGPAWGQEAQPPEPGAEQVSDTPTAGMEPDDPCAPDGSGAVPEMCQSEPVPAAEEQGEEACPAKPVESGDGVVSEGDEGVAVGEPAPGSQPDTDPGAEADPGLEPEPVPADRQPATEEPAADEAPDAVAEEGVVCAFAAPVSAPVQRDTGSTSAGPAGQESVGAEGELPRTGARERLLALAAVGTGLVLVGAGAAAAGRRREVQPA